jgi:GTP-binding protein
LKIRTLELEHTLLDPRRFPRSGIPEIAIAGRSNVGKSSLLNRLLSRRNIARVSKEPGKTRTVNFFLVNGRFYLVDLPGYGYAKVSRQQRSGWQRIITGYLGGRDSLSGVVQLVDARHEPTAEDIVMFQRLIDSERDFLIVLTKADKLRRSQRTGRAASLRSCFEGISVGPRGAGDESGERFKVEYLFSSASTGEGKDAIWKWIEEKI